MEEKVIDVVAVGAGPSALTAGLLLKTDISYHYHNDEDLTYQRKHYSSDLAERKRIRSEISFKAIDPSGEWMHDWRKSFKTLGISWLRSPVVVHPDPFDENALFCYATNTNRATDLKTLNLHQKLSIRGGKKKKKLKSQRPFRSFEDEHKFMVPTSGLFSDFCSNLVKEYGLTDSVQKGYVQGVEVIDEPGTKKKIYKILMADEKHVLARHVIFAGGVSRNRYPDWYQSLPAEAKENCVHSYDIDNYNKLTFNLGTGSVLIIGGGITSGYVAIDLCRRAKRCTLIMRKKKMSVKHFDIPLKWFSKFKNAEMANFYQHDLEGRFKLVREAQDGGSFTPEIASRLMCLQKEVDNFSILQDTTIESIKWEDETSNFVVKYSGEEAEHRFEKVVLALGKVVDITKEPFFDNLLKNHPVNIVCGLPDLKNNLRWGDLDIFVTGAYSSLQIGPNGHNLRGAISSSQRISDAILEGFYAQKPKPKKDSTPTPNKQPPKPKPQENGSPPNNTTTTKKKRRRRRGKGKGRNNNANDRGLLYFGALSNS